jgi:S1-C subfamily serine protease
MYRSCVVTVICAIVFASQPSWAQQLVERYEAFLSERDHFNSNGQRLTTAAAIIRQDRANYHRFGLRDPGDEDDRFFADMNNRATLERLLERGRVDPGVISRIVNENVIVRVEVYTGPRGPFANVMILEHPAAAEGKPKQPAPPKQGAPTGFSGTGFFVAPKHVVTNNHVIKDCGSMPIVISYPERRAERAFILAQDDTNDLALLNTELSSGSVASFRFGLRVGEPVAAYGFPLSGLLSSSGNFTLGNITSLAGPRDDTRVLQTSTPIQPGNSGGPLLDMTGSVVGITEYQLNAVKMLEIESSLPQNVNFAIQAPIVVNFLVVKGVSPTFAEKGIKTLEPAAVAEIAKTFTVQVACRQD